LDVITVLLNEHGDAIYSFCIYLAKNKHDGEDLFQQTFIKAMEISSRIDKNNNPKSYLMSIAVNIWRNTIQKQARRSRITQMIDTGGDEAGLFVDNGVDIELNLINKTMNQALHKIIDKLDDKYRIPVILFYAEDMKISEISSLLHKPEGTIKRRMHEAKKKIKQEMEKMGYE